MLRVEIACTLAAVVIAFVFPNLGSRWFDRTEKRFARFAENRVLAVLTVGVFAVVARLAVLPILPVPDPAIHDEFSYLLMADTFAHGRLANPTPLFWQHFESFHINMIPDYVSKFYPAQGIFLAIGQVFFGRPFWGVVLSCALMCAAICWMLQAWISPVWALLGGMLAVVRFAMFSYWANSYWGGAVAALGGALVLGALPRIRRSLLTRNAIWFAVGAALMVNSRPYEALFLLLPVTVALVIWIASSDAPRIGATFHRIILPAGIVVVATIAGMMVYFWRTTGNPLRPPYLVNEKTYYIAPPFPWLSVKETPQYSSTALRNFFINSQLEEYKLARFHPVLTLFSRIFTVGLFYWGPLLAMPLLALAIAAPYGTRLGDLSKDIRFQLTVFATVCVGMALPAYFAAHYAAELTCVIIALVLYSTRYLRSWNPGGRPIGTALGRSLFVACGVLVFVRIFASSLGIPLTPPRFKTWASQSYSLPERARIVRQLNATPAEHLVFASDGSDPNRFDWVYNGADIESEKIIWARDLGPRENQKLIDHFRGRQVWLVETEKTPPTLSPYR